MKKIYFFIFMTLVFSAPNLLRAQGQTLAESQNEISSNSNSSLGELLFYFKELKQADESVTALPGDQVGFCLKLNLQHPQIAPLLPYLQKIEIELAPDVGDVKLYGNSSHQLKGLKSNADHCYEGSVLIPKKINPAKYIVSEVDLVLSKNRRISLREELQNFSKVSVIDLKAKEVQKSELVFEKIISKNPLFQKINSFGHRSRGQIRFRLLTQDQNAALDTKSLKVFFKLFFDGARIDILQAQCHPTLKGIFFDCKLYVSRAEPDLKGRLMVLKLDSISIEDAFGNLYEMTNEKDLMGLFDGKMLQYVFYSYDPPAQVILPVESKSENLDTNDLKTE